jgi:hypothetical protein
VLNLKLSIVARDYPFSFPCHCKKLLWFFCFVSQKVILIGGEKGNDIPLKEVIMFDIKSGKFSTLPSMIHARRGFSAIITGDLIVVMGGYGSRGRTMSVECYDVSAKTWKDLPSMNEARGHPTALVCPKL